MCSESSQASKIELFAIIVNGWMRGGGGGGGGGGGEREGGNYKLLKFCFGPKLFVIFLQNMVLGGL